MDKFELILSTESKILACNINDFEKQAEQYLATLTAKFETDDDFAKAKEEVKELKTLEDRTREAINGVLTGSKEVSELIQAAESIAERFRQERLSRDKLVKTKEIEVKSNIATAAFEEIQAVQSKQESTISLAMAETLSRSKIQARISEATKNKRTIDGLQKAVTAEKTLILSEIAVEAARLKERLSLIPIAYKHLFADTIKLIASDTDLTELVAERIAAEQQREAEIKAKAEQEAIARAQREAAQTESTATAQTAEATQPAPTPNTPAQNAVENNEPVETFAIYIQATLSQAKAVATQLKRQFPNLRLKRIEE